MDLSNRVYEIIIEEIHQKIKNQKRILKSIKNQKEKSDKIFLQRQKEINDEYNPLIEKQSLDQYIEEIKNIDKENKRAIIFIDQKQEDDSFESFIVIQDKYFNLYRRGIKNG